MHGSIGKYINFSTGVTSQQFVAFKFVKICVFHTHPSFSCFHTGYNFDRISRKCRGIFQRHKCWNVDGRNAMQFQKQLLITAHAEEICMEMWSVSLECFLFLDMHPLTFPPPPHTDPRCPLVNEMSSHIYTTYVSCILGLVGNRVVDNIQLKTLTSGGKYSVSKYTEASTVQINKIVSCRRGWTTIYPALSVFYACIILKIGHTFDNQNF